jgi:hypothetical protein
MRLLLYRCPRTGVSVQALVAEAVIGTNTTLIPLDCPLCNQRHLINLADCAIAGSNKKQ